MHPWHDVTPGDKLPQEFYSIVEIPFGSSVKYELDKTSGMIKLTGSSTPPSTIRPTTDSFRRRSPRTTILSTYWCYARRRWFR